MAETVESGLVVIREFQKRDNGNPPIGTVGPHVLGNVEPPMDVQPWAGWPAGWDTPLWNGWHDLYTRVATVWTCVDLNSRQLASFPAYGMQGRTPIVLPDWADNPEPSIYASWSEFVKQLANTFMLRGEAILWATARYMDGSVARFVALNPDFVSVEWVDGEIVYALAGRPLDRADVCHIKYQTWPSNLRGIGPLDWAGRSLLSASRLEKLGTDLAERGGIPWGVLKHPRKLDKTDATALREAWATAAADRNGAPAVLSGGIELEMLTLSPEQMSLLELRVFDEQRIAAAFGVPPFLVGLPQPSGFTYSNATSLFDFHWRATLRPMASAIAAAMSRWLLPVGQRMEFDRDEYTRPDLGERASAYSTLHGIVDDDGRRAMAIDEIRTAERLGVLPVVEAAEDLTSARDLAEMIQKIYLGVGKVITADEARSILNSVGAGLAPGFVPEAP